MDLFGTILPILAIIAVVGMLFKFRATTRKGSGGTQPLTGAGPKPGLKPGQNLSNIRAARLQVRPTSRRMRQGGTAMGLRRDEYATDMLFLIALDAALDYDEEYYPLCDFIDSPFINDDLDYSGSQFEDYVNQDSPDRFDPPPPPSDRVFTEEQLPPEATHFEDLTVEDDSTKYGGGDSYDSGDSGDSYDSGGGDDW